MKTLADEILDALPALMDSHPNGAAVEDIANLLCAPAAHVRVSMLALHTDGRASLARWPGSKRRYLAPLGHDFGQRRNACRQCFLIFEQPKGRKRICCDRSCAVAWSWKQPGVANDRKNAIRAQKATPEARAAQAENNRRRWSDPEQHARLSEQNRQRWADPVLRATRSASIQAVNGSPEKRAKAAAIRKALWADPHYREKAIAGIKESKSTPEARARFSKLLSERWKDPVMREKYLAGQRANSAKGVAANRGRKQSPEHVRKRVEATRRAREART